MRSWRAGGSSQAGLGKEDDELFDVVKGAVVFHVVLDRHGLGDLSSRRPPVAALPNVCSPVRKVLRAVMVRFDPVGGAPIEIEISEAQGDRVVIQLADHRQNVSDEELETVLGSDTAGPADPALDE